MRQRILVVEDDDDIRELIAALLSEEGFTVDTARDGRDALRVVAERMPQLIVLDMRMPVMDGWEFAARFHATYGSRVPLIVLTAAEDVRKRALEVSAAAWVSKPFDLGTFMGVIERVARKGPAPTCP